VGVPWPSVARRGIPLSPKGDSPLPRFLWETAYKRYRLWNDTGLWQRLFALLGDAPIAGSIEVTL